MTTQTTTKPTTNLAKSTKSKWRLGALLATLASLAVLLSSCEGVRTCWDFSQFTLWSSCA